MFNRDQSNSYDNPAAGEVPLFSHMYVKGMTAEQLYDSLITATGAETGRDRQQAAQQRERWLQDFLRIFGGNEEDEPTLFNGSIPQALLMMNGPLVQAALSGDGNNVFKQILTDPNLRGDEDRIEQLYVAALGRRPSRRESTAIVKSLRTASGDAKLWLYQDLYWALLNSNEFIFNHQEPLPWNHDQTLCDLQRDSSSHSQVPPIHKFQTSSSFKASFVPLLLKLVD
eukprot:TRINITY_DN18879_c0_g1_i7.p1 TRINITY_DN18879_c0_g1~~TRINITY_DN18879_c0_g1_i7.p1  ORF type:complete len:258 (+),score=27.14 TRINITY_DN18879_c0_g1_i7:95-775(+)